MEKELVKKYPYILAWGQSLGSGEYYIILQMEKAEDENAPYKSVFYCIDRKRWITVDECHEHTKSEMENRVKKIMETK